MPFGFFGSLALLVLLGVLIPPLFAFVWPAGIARLAPFLVISILSGVALGVALFWWQAYPMMGVGFSGQGSTEGQSSFQQMLEGRYLFAGMGVLVAQVALCAVLRLVLGRGPST
jgi:hypothetical protein